MALGTYTHTHAHAHADIHMKVISINQACAGDTLALAWFNKSLMNELQN